MSIPCEVVVAHVLPLIRKEMAYEMVSAHHVPQADVARLFGVTDAAVSQYIKKKRTEDFQLEHKDSYKAFMVQVRESVKSLVEGRSEFESEMCRLCNTVTKCRLLDDIYALYVGDKPSTCNHFGSSAGINE